MDGISFTPGKGLRIGALATVADVAAHPVIREKYAVLAEAAGEVASPQLRNVGTVGGNLCQRPRCDYFRGDFNCARKGGMACYAVMGRNKYHCVVGGGPCLIVHPSDLAVALLALDAVVMVQSHGEAPVEVPIEKFFVLPKQNMKRENILNPGDLVIEVIVPDLSGKVRSGYVKVKERGVWDFALVSVAAVRRMDKAGQVDVRIAFGGVAPVPWRESELDRALSGSDLNAAKIEAAAQSALKDAFPLKENAYKIPMARNSLKRLLLTLNA
jgi:xanthine dehydrogenase YagS FAD-binding subunit